MTTIETVNITYGHDKLTTRTKQKEQEQKTNKKQNMKCHECIAQLFVSIQKLLFQCGFKTIHKTGTFQVIN